MRRAIILVVLLFASLSFLLLQIISIRGLDDETTWTSKLGNAMSFGLTKKKDSPAWKNLKTVSQALEDFSLEAFLIEPDILQDLVIDHITDNSSSIWYFAPQFLKSSCRYVCGKSRILLGVFDQPWIFKRDNFEVELVKEGFQSNCCKDQDPRLITVDKTIHSSIDFHCSFTKAGSTIDFVVFYKRQDFLWHGSVSERTNKIKTPGLVFGKTAGAFSRFELKQTRIDDIEVLIPERPNSFLFEMKASKFLECDVKRAQKFYSSYGQEMSEEAERFIVVARSILEIATRTLNALGVRFWLSSGTCLGWFRQCGVIPYSKDVDIGIWIKDYDSRLIERFENYGLKLKHKFGMVEDSFELSFKPTKDNVKLDIFFFYEEKDYMWNGGTQARTGKKFKYIFPKFTLCWTEFLKLKVRVPCETQSYIEANYGQDWNTPVKSWDWKASPANVHPNGEWDKKDWGEVIQLL